METGQRGQIAIKSGLSNSSVASALYTITVTTVLNLLQTFLAEGNRQSRPINQESFMIVGVTGTFTGTFMDPPTMEPVMTDNGYQDALVTRLIAERVQFESPSHVTLPVRGQIVRPSNGRTYYYSGDPTGPVVNQFILADRKL